MKILIHTNRYTYPFDLYSISTPVEIDKSSYYQPEYQIKLKIEKTDVNNSLITSFFDDNNHNIFKDIYKCEFILKNMENITVKNCRLEFNNFYKLNTYYDILIRTPQNVQLEPIKKIRFKKLKEIFNILT